MLALGTLVTSFKAGMADNTWPRTPWHLFLIEWESWGLVIEHTHRFMGQIVGWLMIVLPLGLWFNEPSRRVRFAGIASLSAIMLSGGLGMWLARAKTANAPTSGLNEQAIATEPSWLVWTVIGIGVAGLIA